MTIYELKKSAEAWCDEHMERKEVLAVIIVALHSDGTVVQSAAKYEDPRLVCSMMASDAAKILGSNKVPMAYMIQGGRLKVVPKGD